MPAQVRVINLAQPVQVLVGVQARLTIAVEVVAEDGVMKEIVRGTGTETGTETETETETEGEAGAEEGAPGKEEWNDTVNGKERMIEEVEENETQQMVKLKPNLWQKRIE
eukprot:m.91323 g.91323  ORF g.91323 m.91323 type:complete len:110 (+) comp36679_c0_seq15:1944-2273(+)